MIDRCSTCRSENDEDECHAWFFESQNVDVLPRIDPESGEAMMWAGYGGQDSSLEDSRADGEIYFDENSIVHQDGDAASWGCSPLPLVDQTNRPSLKRVSLGKPFDAKQAMKEVELLQLQDALKKKEEEHMAKDAQHFEIDLQHGNREKYLRDATAHQEKYDEEIAMREQAVAQKEAALDKVKFVLDARELQLRDQEQKVHQGADEATK